MDPQTGRAQRGPSSNRDPIDDRVVAIEDHEPSARLSDTWPTCPPVHSWNEPSDEPWNEPWSDDPGDDDPSSAGDDLGRESTRPWTIPEWLLEAAR
jgi:hypothetical protein